MTIGEVIRSRRQELGLSQRDLARAVGCKPHWISMLESSAAAFPRKKWERFADALRIEKTSFLYLILKDLVPGIESYRVIKFDE